MVTADRGFGARRAIQSDPLPAHDSAVRHVHMRRLDGRHDSAERRARQAYGLRQAGALIALGMDNAECKLYAARMDMTEAVAAALRAEMAARRITYRQLAERAGVPERTLARVLKPERDIKIDTLVALTKAWGIPLVVFIGQAEQLRDRL